MPASSERTGDSDGRAARRAVWLAVAAGLLVAIALAVVVSGTDDRSTLPGGLGPDVDVGPAPLGPAPGVDIESYRADRQAALASLRGDDRRAALVSFATYRTEPDARQRLTLDPDRVEVVAWFAAAPGGAPTLAADLVAWASREREEATVARAEVEQLLPTVAPDVEYEAFYRAELVRLAAVIAGADPAGPVVFGALVRAPGAALHSLASRSAIRLVDIGPGETADPSLDHTALLPDDVRVVPPDPRRPTR